MSIGFFNKIVLLEDDQSHALLIKRALAPFATNLVHCSSLNQALESLLDSGVELIITDLNLPDSQGTSHVDKLRDASKNTPILVLTSSTSLNDAIDAMKRGARDFIVKNFDKDFAEVLRISLSRVYASIELERDKQRITRQMETLRVAIENNNDGMAVADSQGKITYANRSFAGFISMCGGSAESIFSIFADSTDKKDDLLRRLRHNVTKLSPGSAWHSEVTFVDRKDAAFDLLLSAIAGEPGNPAVDSYVIWVRDISEQKRREKFQREILSTTTHDLKGPLGAILISCELLAGMVKGQPKVSELVMRIDSSARGSVNLIDEFLSARRIQEGTFILRPAPCDIPGLIRETIEDYRTIAGARGISLTFEEDGAGFEAKVDKLGFTRVLGNLLSNALKFTPKGGSVKVRCRLEGDYFHLEVEDSGSGMEPGEVQKIFERFSRLDKHRDIVGTGIGLFVVKSIVTAHDGKVEVTSKVGEGTAFDISFPVSPPVNQRGELISLDFA